MRKTLLAAAAMLGTTLALPVLAQTNPPPAAASGSGGAANDGPEDFLKAAKQDVQHRRGAAAEQALEKAETRLLDRSTLASEANQPDSSPAVQAISQAIAAVGKRDWQTARQQIDTALQQAQMAQSGSGQSGSGQAGSGQAGNAMTAPTSATAPAAMPDAAAPAGGTMPAQGGTATGAPATPPSTQ